MTPQYNVYEGTELVDTLNTDPPTRHAIRRHSLHIEFPADTHGGIIADRLATVVAFAEDITHTIGGKVVGTYEEDYT